jgi:putative addiction module component (TIGR02574 family)
LRLYTPGILNDEVAMISPVDDLANAAMALPRSERARLAERLLASLDEDAGVEEAWAQEVQNRLDLYRAGRLDAVPAAEVHEEARRRLSR